MMIYNTDSIMPALGKNSEFVEEGIDTFNQQQLNLKKNRIAKNYVIKNKYTVIAGINSWFYFDNELVYVSVLFVDEEYRHKGLGSLLLNKIEVEAKGVGAALIHLDTFDFQAKDFYLKHGYEIFGVLDGPGAHHRYYMKKSL